MKKNYLSFLPLVVVIFSFSIVHAQQKSKALDKEIDNSETEQQLENLSENNNSESIDFTTQLDNLLYYTNHPINLNSTNFDELNTLGLLNEIQITNLLFHINKNGKLIRLEELQSINGFDLLAIKKIFPYVFVSDKLTSPNATFKDIITKGKHSIIARTQFIVESEQGYLPIADSVIAISPNSRYLGNRLKNFLRYRYTFGNNINWGFTAEKDAGEQFFKGSQKQGFDYYSAHFTIRNFGKIKSLSLGDYQVQFGQGLTFSTGIAYGKTADVMAVKRNYVGSRAYTSVNENIFLRGAAANVALTKNIHTTVFLSSKRIDASLRIDENDTLTITNLEDIEVSALQISGFHRTPNELQGRNAVRENVIGGNLMYQSRTSKIGLTHAYVNYSNAIVKQNKIYNQFDLQGNQFYNTGLEFSKVWRNFNFFGEISRSHLNSYAAIIGSVFTLDSRITASFIYRNYPRTYQAPFSNAFAESTRNNNEKGFYIGLNVKTTSFANLALYYDQFKYQWLKFGVSAPSNGSDALAQYTYTPNKKVNMYARFRQRNKLRNTQEDVDDIDFLVSAIQQNYRYEITYAVGKYLRMKNRVELVRYKQGVNEQNAQGYLAYHDIAYKQISSPVAISFRYALFNAPTFNTSLYAYESDVLSAFSIPSFYGRGIRTYAIVRYKPLRNLDIWLRIARTVYADRQVISTGLSQINSNARTEIKVQARIIF